MTTSPSQTKQDIRSLMKRKQAEFPANQAARETEAFWTAVEQSENFKNARTVLLYMAIPGEIPTESFIRKWSADKRIAIPKVVSDRLELREYSSMRLQNGYKGILEPSDEAPLIAPSEIDFAVIPGVAFAACETGDPSRGTRPETERHYKRLGRGKGFYDRLLPLLHCPRIPAGFSFRFLNGLPTDGHDATI